MADEIDVFVACGQSTLVIGEGSRNARSLASPGRVLIRYGETDQARDLFDRERITARFPPHARELKTSADIEAWNRGEIALGLIHPASAGHGLNLQSGGHLLVWFSLTWSLELYQQTNARLYRQGQSEPVTITHLIAGGTLDEAVLRALDAKDATQAALIDAVHKKSTQPLKGHAHACDDKIPRHS
ncbi:DEAD/DEAH box helicase [Alloscardovia sp. HMSC034E08]|uniref:DEAD/DEAH box helicase n=1 Tax=Alloscardovia sp. HMSC034E08 TaxID=1739413 RepID=UPI000ABA092E|nr:DEAD/DEAH box helicase [Alloscardovia sp. HMSC034E08]